MRFRPCIDLHNGQVKQIVGGTLRDAAPHDVVTNFIAPNPPAYYADLYRRDGLEGGHVIMLGPGNDDAARAALAAYPGGLQIGGGMNTHNAPAWLEAGAAKIIVTSYVFQNGQVCWDRLKEMQAAADSDRLVLDLSCRRRGDRYYIVTDRWQNFTDVEVERGNLDRLAAACSEFLIHAVDVEGKQQGIEETLVRMLSGWHGIPITYAGGIRSMDDISLVSQLSGGGMDFTVGSSLDIFGGRGLRYDDLVAFDRTQRGASGVGRGARTASD